MKNVVQYSTVYFKWKKKYTNISWNYLFNNRNSTI
jgi:hypothetical protein